MKGAGLIYLLCGFLLVGAGLFGTTFGKGFAPGAIGLALFGVGFLVLGRGLLISKPGVRSYAVACSALITIGFGVEAISLAVGELPALRKFGATPMFWWIVGPFAAIALAHALALVLLLRSKPAPLSQ